MHGRRSQLPLPHLVVHSDLHCRACMVNALTVAGQHGYLELIKPDRFHPEQLILRRSDDHTIWNGTKPLGMVPPHSGAPHLEWYHLEWYLLPQDADRYYIMQIATCTPIFLIRCHLL